MLGRLSRRPAHFASTLRLSYLWILAWHTRLLTTSSHCKVFNDFYKLPYGYHLPPLCAAVVHRENSTPYYKSMISTGSLGGSETSEVVY